MRRRRKPTARDWPIGYALWQHAVAPDRGENPAPGTELCPEFRLYHDAAHPLMAWRQMPGAAGLALTVYQFDGSYISLAAGLARAEAATLRPGQVLGVHLAGRASRPLNIFLRLNLTADDRHETLHDAFILSDGGHAARFDLTGLPLAFGPRMSAWLDIILTRPAMCEVEIDTLGIALSDSGEDAA